MGWPGDQNEVMRRGTAAAARSEERPLKNQWSAGTSARTSVLWVLRGALLSVTPWDAHTYTHVHTYTFGEGHMCRSEDSMQRSRLSCHTDHLDRTRVSGPVASAFRWWAISLVGTCCFIHGGGEGPQRGLTSDLTEEDKARAFAVWTLLGVPGAFHVLAAVHQWSSCSSAWAQPSV